MVSVRIVSLACMFACFVAAGIDPYVVLGVARDADEKTIKLRYRQLSKQYHPDKNPSKEAHDKFIEVGEAYGILNDAKKRENYDRFGDPEPQHQHMGHGDIFNQFFNGGGGFGGFGGQHQGKRRGGDTQVSIDMPLLDFYIGRDLSFAVELQNICGACEGSGSADGERKKCGKCNGLGVFTKTVQIGPMIQRFQSQCDHCQGTGTTIAQRCKTCKGAGTAQGARDYNFYVAPGTPKNHMHVLEGEGAQHPDWTPGNLNVKLQESLYENWGFRRVGDNLYRTEVLTLLEADFGGWKRQIRLFDDELVEISRAVGHVTINGQVDVLYGHGMPLLSDHDVHGHLYVDYRVLPVPSAQKSRREKDEL